MFDINTVSKAKLTSSPLEENEIECERIKECANDTRRRNEQRDVCKVGFSWLHSCHQSSHTQTQITLTFTREFRFKLQNNAAIPRI